MTTLTTARNLLEHSFYQRWVKGELSLGELQDYACQYSHVVLGLPGFLRAAAMADRSRAAALSAHADEEDGHVALWARFANSLGVSDAELAASRPNAATAALLQRGAKLASGPAGAAVAWALEVQTPAVSEEKIAGLKKHYGIDEASGGEYFELHRTRDLDHAGELAAVIGTQAGAQAVADETLDLLWDVLTSVERRDS